ncbi:MAG: DUF6326 family protein [Flavobacteriaceae bacterium]
MKGLLKDTKVDVKLRLAALWASLMSLYIYCDYFDMKTPGTIENFVELKTPVGEVTPRLLLIFSLILIVPALMIGLSTLMRPVINKWANIIVATIWSSMSFIILFWDLMDFNPWYMFYDLYQVVEIVVLILIVRTAWKWPRVTPNT